MDNKNESKKINIENRTCYYFDFDKMLSDKKSYKKL